MTTEELREFNHLLKIATEEASTKVLTRILELLKSSTPADNSGLEELGYVAAERLAERGAL